MPHRGLCALSLLLMSAPAWDIGMPVRASLSRSGQPAAQATVELDKSFRLRGGEAVDVSGTSMRVRFDTVSEDSRCPAGVACVWAGDAVVQLTVSMGGATTRVELHTNAELKQDRHVRGDYRVRLIALEPLPTASAPVTPSAYVVTLVVERAP